MSSRRCSFSKTCTGPTWGCSQLLGSLAVRLADAPLLMLALARDELLDNEPTWARLPRNLTLKLEALDGAHANDLVRRLLVHGDDSDSIVTPGGACRGRQSAAHRGAGSVAVRGRGAPAPVSSPRT